MNTKLTLKSGKSVLKACGMSIIKRDGEYRVYPSAYTFPQYTNEEREAVAYYSDDIQDAVSTGQHMARQLRAGRHPSAYTARIIETGYVCAMRSGEHIATYYKSGPHSYEAKSGKYHAVAGTYEEALGEVLKCLKYDDDKAVAESADRATD